jgi:phenylalanyl-tRNA synthetase alpha chain
MIPNSILSKIGKNLYNEKDHPISIVKRKIYSALPDFQKVEGLNPYVSIQNNFDSLLIPQNYPLRSKSDVFYRDDETVLRTHMTAHLTTLAISGYTKFITCGDVFRKDSIDRNHYPVFHQIDGFALLDNHEMPSIHLRDTLAKVIFALFGESVEFRFIEELDGDSVYYPFTVNSCEVEIKFFNPETREAQWLEVLGAGTVSPKIMNNIGLPRRRAWAFGMGLERLAMILFNIPDIRLFWSTDPRFSEQFREDKFKKFSSFSKYPTCYKDISFWVPISFNKNDLFSIIREEGKDLAEEVKFLSEFYNIHRKKTSHHYRIFYSNTTRSLTNKEVNDIQISIKDRLLKEFNIELL